MPTHHEWLVARFSARLLTERPASVLDVGCGAGLLLRTLHAHGVPSVAGVDRAGPRLDALQAEGLVAMEGSAYELPGSDDSVEWVTMRHIPHHLEDPARAFAEALRVATKGVLIAEPWFDVSLPSQAAALRYDQLDKSLDRRQGSYHAESLLLTDLLAALPQGYDEHWQALAFTDLRVEARDGGEALGAIASRLEGLLEEGSFHEEYAAVEAQVRRDGMSFNGSLSLMLQKR